MLGRFWRFQAAVTGSVAEPLERAADRSMTRAKLTGAAVSSGVVAAFAKAVMVPGVERVLRVGPDNRGDGYLTLGAALESGCAFSVEVREDLLVADADMSDAAEITEGIAAALRDAGYTPVVWSSGSPGHRQLLVRLSDGREMRRWSAMAKSLGMDVRRYTRPPLSPHRRGYEVALLAPDGVQEALDALAGDWGAPAPDRLTQRTWNLLRWGDPRSPSGSEVVYRIAMGMLAKGWSRDQAYRFLLDPQNVGGDALRRRVNDRGERAGHAWFDGVWRGAARYLDANPPFDRRDATEVRVALAAVLDEADSYPWPEVRWDAQGGRDVDRVRGTSMRKALEGLVSIGSRAATAAPYASERHLLDTSGLGSAVTLRKAIRGLVDLGWVKILSKGAGRKATTYLIIEQGTRRNDAQDHIALRR